MKSSRRVEMTFTHCLKPTTADWLLNDYIIPGDLIVESLNPAYLLAATAEVDEQPIMAMTPSEDCLRVTYIPEGVAGRMTVLIPVRYVMSYRETYEVDMRGD